MNIEEILDDMDDLLDRSRPIPFAAHKAVIDADRMRELLNSAHLNIPAEIKRAKLIDSDCDRIINEAREKAEAIIQDAETRASRMISEQAILQEAKKRALDMLTKAQNGSNDIKDAAEKYPQHKTELVALGNTIAKGYFKKPELLKAVFPSLDNFKYLDKHYVFNVGGNELRVVAMVFFESQKCYIREVMTHKEYDFFTAVHRTKGKK